MGPNLVMISTFAGSWDAIPEGDSHPEDDISSKESATTNKLGNKREALDKNWPFFIIFGV